MGGGSDHQYRRYGPDGTWAKAPGPGPRAPPANLAGRDGEGVGALGRGEAAAAASGARGCSNFHKLETAL